MFTNDEEVVDPKVAEDVGEEPADIDTTDWKAEAIKARGIAKRNATRIEKLKNTKVEVPVEKTLKTEKGFDFSEKSYMRSAGLKPSEYDLVQQYTDSGKSLDDVLDEGTTVGRLFALELKERRETQTSKEAIPQGSKRSGSSTKDNVEYWVAKGELPPAGQTKLRREVIAARMAQEKNTSKFSPRSFNR